MLNHKPIFIQLEQIKKIRTKNGQNMAFITINDGHNTMDGVVFPDVYKKYEQLLSQESMLTVRGKFERRNNKLQLIISQISSLEEFEQAIIQNARQIVIRQDKDIDEIAQLSNEETTHSLPVEFYDETTNKMNFIGYINNDDISQFILHFDPADIRII